MKECAYCGNQGSITKEHIWPKCIIKRTPDYQGRYHGKNEAFFRGELTIKDVCEECNNGELSRLDEYICELYDSYFERIARQGSSIVFNYYQKKLLRWLLKISYNSARSNNTHTEELRDLAPFIMGESGIPNNISVRAELLRPSRNPNYVKGNGSEKYIEPRSVRCCRIESQLGKVPGVTLRLVGINSYYFWVSIFPSGVLVSEEEEAHLTGILSLLPNQELVGKCSVRLRARGRSTIDMHKDWVLNPRASESHKRMMESQG